MPRCNGGGDQEGVGHQMSVLSDLVGIVTAAGLPVETGKFCKKAPDEYVVITPLFERFALHADNAPGINIEEYRLSLFCKLNYNAKKWQLVRALLQADFTITDRSYLLPDDLYEQESGYHHFAIDVAKAYELEEE